MTGSLLEMDKEQLISNIQDYQEMIFEIEGVINSYQQKPHCLLQIRDIINKHVESVPSKRESKS